MEHDEALLESLAALRAAHDKANRLMAEIAALGARALKGRGSLPSLVQLQNYAQALAQAQRQAVHCEELLLGGPSSAMPGAAASSRPCVH
ncbi:hypothetical protein GTP41_13915 [Pseudoduganella sp. DS3]|uniref:Uncharacterized protein n=1 Tax=Pseudoduganella guangdongensis TaxID=2692179 RepID=A0A6N9HHV2_9BURK|nr:hypothetical protein [Pseudoduganella guangdongensis]MYN03188.1 hypothetical protein [Pseudoduganella guangdongensis]